MLLSKKSVVLRLYGYFSPNFKGSAQFCSGHKITLNQGILSCSCCFKKIYGIPCRHLFCIEPNYNTEDIHCRWQKAYSIYCYAEAFQDVTKVYKRLMLLQHWEIRN